MIAASSVKTRQITNFNSRLGIFNTFSKLHLIVKARVELVKKNEMTKKSLDIPLRTRTDFKALS